MYQIKPAELKILKAIAKYKYQSTSHLLRQGIQTKKQNIHKSLSSLKNRKRPLIQSINGNLDGVFGKREYIYYLTKWGKEILVSENCLYEEEIKMPSTGATHFTSDYEHRTGTINFAISLDQWSERSAAEVLYFDTYFDKVGNNRVNKNLRAKSRIDLPDNKYIIPDANFVIETQDVDYKLFSFELHNGKDSKRAIKQMRKHALALSEGSYTSRAQKRCREVLVDDNFELVNSCRILFVFEHVGTMNAVIRRMQALPFFKFFDKHFVFKSLAGVTSETFATGWTTFQGEEIEIC